MTIRMNSGTTLTGNLQIPAPSLAIVAVVNGVGSVLPQDVPTAIRFGWTPMQGENWPGARVVHLSAPAGGNWPVNGTITFPDGTTAAVTNGAAVIPIAWVDQYIQYGWGPTPVLSGLDL
jgi:hypothetical protein